MTRQKSFKAKVRKRMDKTAESYTTARRRLVDKAASATDPSAAEPTAIDSTATDPATAGSTATDSAAGQPPVTSDRPADGIKALRRSEAPVRERTGRSWDEWFALLDEWGGTDHTHTEIARWLVEQHQVDGWWAQSVTVAYEQERGIRAPGQRSDGYYSPSASKTIAVPVDRLFEAFADPRMREQWLPGVALTVRTATAPKTFRAVWEDDSSRLVVGFTAKGDAKAQVGVVHEKITDADTADRMKAYWRERLAVLKRLLET